MSTVAVAVSQYFILSQKVHFLCSVRPSSDPATAKTGPLLEVALGLSSLEQTNSVPITVLIRLLLLNIGTSTYPLKAREGHWSKYILARNPVAIFIPFVQLLRKERKVIA